MLIADLKLKQKSFLVSKKFPFKIRKWGGKKQPTEN